MSPRKLWLLVFFPLLLLYGATSTSRLDHLSPDPVAAALPARQLALHGNLDLAGQGYDIPWIAERNGRRTSDRSPGIVAVAVPFYAVLGRGPFTMGPARLAAALIAAAAMATLCLVFARLASRRTALAATAVVALATSTWGVSADALWPHGPDQLYIALAMLATANGLWLCAGLAFAFAILTRAHLAAAAAVTGGWLSAHVRAWRPVVLIGACSTAALLAVLAYTRAVMGHIAVYSPERTSNLVHSSALFTAVNLLGAFVSPSRGLLVLCPFLLPLLPGLPQAWRAAPVWVRTFAVGGVLYLLLQSRVNYFTGGTRFWGPRLALESLTLWSPLLLLCWLQWTSALAWRRRVFTALVVLSVGYQAMGALYFTAPPVVIDPWRHNWVQDLLRLGADPLVAAAYHPYRAGARAIAGLTVVLAVATLSRRGPTPASRRR